MLCCKKASYTPANQQKSNTNKKPQPVTLKGNTKLKSFRKKSSKDKKDSLTLNFTSYLKR